jgi:hypothetical protein
MAGLADSEDLLAGCGILRVGASESGGEEHCGEKQAAHSFPPFWYHVPQCPAACRGFCLTTFIDTRRGAASKAAFD